MYRTHRIPALRAAFAALLALFALACEDGPAAPASDEDLSSSVLDEGTFDLAAAEVDTRQTRMIDEEGEANRHRPVDRRRPPVDRVGLVVELSGTAVALATRILDEQGAEPPQEQQLELAAEFQAKAEAALADGNTHQAVDFAIKACWTALKAIVIPGGISEEEARMIHDLAEDLLTQAAEVVGDEPSIEKTLFEWAVQFYVHGANQLEEGDLRGVASLWKAAVLAAHILE